MSKKRITRRQFAERMAKGLVGIGIGVIGVTTLFKKTSDKNRLVITTTHNKKVVAEYNMPKGFLNSQGVCKHYFKQMGREAIKEVVRMPVSERIPIGKKRGVLAVTVKYAGKRLVETSISNSSWCIDKRCVVEYCFEKTGEKAFKILAKRIA